LNRLGNMAIVFSRNNLYSSSSPYLRQHKDNPVWWQEWNEDVLSYAKRENKILFVSVGYSTCHWCHVMAQEAFSDEEVARYLNRHFVSIKVDREQRSDIDHYLMSFLVASQGQGGWPLNCFLTSDLKPIYALTYAPAISHHGMLGFHTILTKIKEFYDTQAHTLKAFVPPDIKQEETSEEDIIDAIGEGFDSAYGGFGQAQKFPPHCTLLFMLYYFEVTHDDRLKNMIQKTLDVMYLGGLHDHLQGGFFRYCIEKKWAIPHFEKMLYDQAMLLWAYSLAFKVFKKLEYRIVAEKLLACLRETFQTGDLFCSGYDADTDHREGATYLWSDEELRTVLTEIEYARLADVYDISQSGNFENKNHLIKKKNMFLKDIDAKLLKIRKRRRQPFVDRKIITSWNCLAGIGLVHAYRYLGDTTAFEEAEALLFELLDQHFVEGQLAHSSIDGQLQKQEFLQDYAGILLLLSYLHEETKKYENHLHQFYEKLEVFRKEGAWIEALNPDFIAIRAEAYDHPVPSSRSLAELALIRTEVLLGKSFTSGKFTSALASDFLNIAVILSNGLFHIIKTPARISWADIPINVIQVQGKKLEDCYRGTCKPFP